VLNIAVCVRRQTIVVRTETMTKACYRFSVDATMIVDMLILIFYAKRVPPNHQRSRPAAVFV